MLPKPPELHQSYKTHNETIGHTQLLSSDDIGLKHLTIKNV